MRVGRVCERGAVGTAIVRSAAIRALEESAGPRLIEPMLEVLASPEQRDPQVVAPNDSVRWDAIGAIASVVESGADVSEHRDAIVATAIRLLGGDPSRR